MNLSHLIRALCGLAYARWAVEVSVLLGQSPDYLDCARLVPFGVDLPDAITRLSEAAPATGLGAQMGWARQENQVCLAYLIRDVQYAIEAGDAVPAPGIRHLLGRACRIGRRREPLADATLKHYETKLDQRLDAIMARAPANAAGVKLQRMIKKIRRRLFVFVTRRDVPPTNNGSERALRPCVTFRKITSGFRTEWGARLSAQIRSVIETARRRSISALQAIRLTLAGTPLTPKMA